MPCKKTQVNPQLLARLNVNELKKHVMIGVLIIMLLISSSQNYESTTGGF
ncbi:hypothetical protein SAMN05720591_12414 [Halolactibacillus alkaliphilus]|nr:hypothetical protein SAMN05720591_12414 [Halolactibacillus alkaliphilus]